MITNSELDLITREDAEARTQPCDLPSPSSSPLPGAPRDEVRAAAAS